MRVKTGIDGFDELTDGGLLSDRLYLLSGPPGSGKTTFAAQFATQGAIQNENALYMSMHETGSELVDDMSSFDFRFREAMEAERIRFLDLLDSKTQRLLSRSNSADFSAGVQNMTNQLVGVVEANDFDRLVIDSTMLLRYLFEDDADALIQFLTGLKRVDTTTLLISEMTDPTSYADEHYLAHGVIFLHNYLESSGMTRGVQIVKMRGTEIDCDIREAEFTDGGLTVYPDEKVQQ